MTDIISGSDPHSVNVNDDNELHVCLCKKACEGTITMTDLLLLYPGLHVSIRKEQLEGDMSDVPKAIMWDEHKKIVDKLQKQLSEKPEIELATFKKALMESNQINKKLRNEKEKLETALEPFAKKTGIRSYSVVLMRKEVIDARKALGWENPMAHGGKDD